MKSEGLAKIKKIMWRFHIIAIFSPGIFYRIATKVIFIIKENI